MRKRFGAIGQQWKMSASWGSTVCDSGNAIEGVAQFACGYRRQLVSSSMFAVPGLEHHPACLPASRACSSRPRSARRVATKRSSPGSSRSDRRCSAAETGAQPDRPGAMSETSDGRRRLCLFGWPASRDDEICRSSAPGSAQFDHLRKRGAVAARSRVELPQAAIACRDGRKACRVATSPTIAAGTLRARQAYRPAPAGADVEPMEPAKPVCGRFAGRQPRRCCPRHTCQELLVGQASATASPFRIPEVPTTVARRQSFEPDRANMASSGRLVVVRRVGELRRFR
jgi:hypothetical protein